MPTYIRFAAVSAGEPMTVKVSAEIDEVEAAWSASKGNPFTFQRANGARVIINPNQIAYLLEEKPRGGGAAGSTAG